MTPTDTTRPQCQATVYVPETYRWVGGKQRFRMHDARQQCSRRAAEGGGGYCWQHVRFPILPRATPKEQP